MAEPSEEVTRLVRAIEAIEAIEDDAECASEVSKALKEWPRYHARLRELRQSRVQALRAQQKSWQEIADIIGGITPSRAQQIGAGLRGMKRPAPKKKRAPRASGGGPSGAEGGGPES